METKALILDLDNTIFPTSLLGDELFADVYDIIARSEAFTGDLRELKADMNRKAFPVVALKYGIEAEVYRDCVKILGDIEYKGTVAPFADYPEIRKLHCDKFLV